MNRKLFVLFAMLTSMAGSAQIKTVQLSNDKDTRNIKKPDLGIPVVKYDDFKVVVSSDSLPQEAYITILGTRGNVMYSGFEVVTPAGMSIPVQDTSTEQKHKIEVLIGRNRLSGYFD